MAAKKKNESVIEVQEIRTVTLDVYMVGKTPMICNAMSAKVRQDLLMPPRTKSKAERQTTLKHDPLAEYRRSPYRTRGDDAETRIVFPGGGFKAAVAQAAVDIPGAARAKVGRLCFVDQDNIPVWGVPQMLMSVVRQAGISRTPDVRTRAIIPRWAARASVTFVTPQLTEQAVGSLIASAGIIVGLGDWRPEKGKGSYGQFRLATDDDPELLEIMAAGGREAQDAALESPDPYDAETEELYSWWASEVTRREMEPAREPKRQKKQKEDSGNGVATEVAL